MDRREKISVEETWFDGVKRRRRSGQGVFSRSFDIHIYINEVNGMWAGFALAEKGVSSRSWLKTHYLTATHDSRKIFSAKCQFFARRACPSQCLVLQFMRATGRSRQSSRLVLFKTESCVGPRLRGERVKAGQQLDPKGTQNQAESEIGPF